MQNPRNRYCAMQHMVAPTSLNGIIMPGLFDATGLVAALLTTLAFLPQVIQTWRSGSTDGLNLGMLAALSTGLVLWLVYGLGTGQLPVILANGATLALVATLLALKLRERVGRS